MGLSVEMTAYAVLSLVKLGGERNLISALEAVRWISKHRNAQGGFVSTQVVMTEDFHSLFSSITNGMQRFTIYLFL